MALFLILLSEVMMVKDNLRKSICYYLWTGLEKEVASASSEFEMSSTDDLPF